MDSIKPTDVDKELREQKLQSDRSWALDRDRERSHKNRIYWVVFFYFLVVVLNAAGVVILFILRAFSIGDVPFEVLSKWALGTGGLGAGSLVFRKPASRLFAK